MIKVGCCGFPKGMKHYFSRFKVVEVQQTFYKPPQLETAIKWRKEAPPDFEFTIKAWQLITHPASSPTYRKAGLKIAPEKEDRYGSFKPTEEVREAWGRTKEIAQALKAKVIVFQCPPRFRESEENVRNMREFFQNLGREFLFAWEPRGGWSEERIESLCQELDLVHCVDPSEREALFGKIGYFRLHGGPGYRHSYSDEELEQIKERVKGGYLLFNNITMYDDALRFMKLLGEFDA